jgi:Phage tail assembly chaperone protein, TAC
MTFTEMASQLAGQVPVLLGWKPDDFWGATPAELTAIFAAFAPRMDGVVDAQSLKQMMEQFPDG